MAAGGAWRRGRRGRRGTHLKFKVPDEGSCDWKGVSWVDLEERVVPEDAVAVVVDIECRHLLRPRVGNLVRHQDRDFERDAWRSGVRAWRLGRIRHRVGSGGAWRAGPTVCFGEETCREGQGPRVLCRLPVDAREPELWVGFKDAPDLRAAAGGWLRTPKDVGPVPAAGALACLLVCLDAVLVSGQLVREFVETQGCDPLGREVGVQGCVDDEVP